MNRIYRLIWNTTLACWVVASEHTRSRGKRTRTGRSLLAAAALALTLPALADEGSPPLPEEGMAEEVEVALLRWYGDPMLRSSGLEVTPDATPSFFNRQLSAIVNDTHFQASRLSGENSLVLGSRSSVTGNRSTALGNEIVIVGGGHTAVGSKVLTSGKDTVGMGINAAAHGDGNVAIGAGAEADTAEDTLAGIHAVALGAYAKAGSPGWTGAVAIGGETLATHDATALGYKANAQNYGAMALGRESVGNGIGAIALGRYSNAQADDAIAIGDRAQALRFSSVALGGGAKAQGGKAVAIGTGALVLTEGGTHGVALGVGARAGTAGWSGGTALGGAAAADYDGVAVGHEARATAVGSVAIGRGALADAADTVSVGNASHKRRIVNVADGALTSTSSETVTGKQLFSTNQNVSTALNTANVAKTTADAAKVDATDALNKATLVSGLIGQVSATGNVRVGAENTGAVLDVRNKVNANRTVSGVADGVLSAASSEAVSGKQLYSTNQNVTTATNTANVAKTTADAAKVDATDALNKATLVSGLIGQVSATGNVRVGAENTGSVLDVRNKVNVNRTVSGVADGALSAASSEAVSGKQLFATNQNVTTAATTANLAKITADAAQIDATAALEKASLVSGLIGEEGPAGAVRLGGENTGSVLNVRNKNDADRTLSGVADATLAAISNEAVTGRQLFATNQNVTTATNTANLAKTAAESAQVDATTALDKATLVSGLIGQEGSDGQLYLGAENSGFVMDVRNKNSGTRTITGLAAGHLDTTSTEAVNGAQLHATNQQVEVQSIAIAGNRRDIGSNRDGLAELRDAFDKYVPDLSGVVKFSDDFSIVDLDGAGVTGMAEGTVVKDSTDAVNGAQLHATNERVSSIEHQQRFQRVGAKDTSNPAQAGVYGVALGADANAAGEGSTAIGSFATALGVNSVALGRGSHVGLVGEDSFALGTRTRVGAAGGLAVGADSVVLENADRSVALGVDSIAGEAETISVGNNGLKRRVVNIGRGVKGDDASAISQLSDAVSIFGAGASVDSLGNIVEPNYVLQSGQFNNVGDALTSLDSNLLDQRGELDALDARYQEWSGGEGQVRFNADRSVVDFGGATLTGVSAGTVSIDSTDAVNGAQLYGTNDRVGELEHQRQYVQIGTDELSRPAFAGELAVAVGGDAKALVEGATAIGSYSNAHAVNSVALGRGSYVAAQAEDGFAVGSRSNALAQGALSIGASTMVMKDAKHAVALGYSSIATEANTLSLGNDHLKRRIVNVGKGINPDDATTVAQLRGTLSALGGGATLDAGGNVVAPRYKLHSGEYSNYGDALSALDNSVVDGKRDLDSLDTRFQRLFQESPSANTDGVGRLSLGGAQGMVLGNVANGLIGQGSRDAVNGGQLWAVQQDLQGQIDAIGDDAGSQSDTPVALQSRPARSAGEPGTGVQGQPIAAADTGAGTPVAQEPSAQDPVVRADGDDAVAVGSEGKERAVRHVAEGRANTDAVNVRQLNDAVERANEYTDNAVAGVNKRLEHMDKRINRMAAMSSAQSAMAMNTAGLQTANRLGAGVGYSEGESAMSVGYQRVLNERGSATFSLNGAFTNSGEKSVGMGVGIGW